MKKDIKVFGFEKGIDLISGEKLESFQLKVETYGELNSTKSNAVLVCHAFSGSHHVAGNDDELGVGWWDQFVGPGKPIDTNIYFVVCCNNLGGCFGSTGPSSLNPKTQKVYGSTFPNVGVTDWVRSQKMLMEKMKIPYWHLVIGGSLGGMQALEWAIQFPKFIKKAGIIAAAANSSPQNIAMNEVARESIKKDPNYCDGNYAEHGVFPKNGIKTARMLGHITYLSEEHMNQRFGRKFQDDDTKVFEDVNFEVENYLQYKGEKFSSLFDANSYILMTKAMDDYDAGKKRELSSILKNVEAELLIIGFYSDWLYPPEKGKAIQIAAMNNNIKSSYIVLDGEHGHDSFLFATDKYSRIIKNFIKS